MSKFENIIKTKKTEIVGPKKLNKETRDFEYTVKGGGKTFQVPIKKYNKWVKLYKPKTKKIFKNLRIFADIEYDISEDKGQTTTVDVNEYYATPQYTRQFETSDIDQKYVYPAVQNWIDEWDGDGVTFRIIKVHISEVKGDKEIKLSDQRTMKMREIKYLPIDHLFNEKIIKHQFKEGECAKAWLKKMYPKLTKQIDNLGDENGISTIEILEFCKLNNIQLIVFNIDGRIIERYIPKKRDHHLKRLVYICYNSHMYPLKNKTLTKKIEKQTDIKQEIKIENCKQKISEFLNNGKNVKDVKFSKSNKKNDPDDLLNIKSFVIDNTLYFQNSDYDICKKLLSLCGLEDRIKPDTTLRNVMSIIEPTYCKDDISQSSSFFPIGKQLIKGGYLYSSRDFDDSRPFCTSDKVKAYTYSLYDLKFLIVADYMTNRIVTKFDKNYKIIDHYLYIAKPIKQTTISKILLPSTCVYYGEHLNRCQKEKFQFELLECLPCSKIDNYMTEMIERLYEYVYSGDIDAKTMKDVINKFIGKMERCKMISSVDKFITTCDKDQEEYQKGSIIPVDSKWSLNYVTDEIYSVTNRKPIGIQIKDNSRWILYEHIKQLGIKGDDIIQINTDSVTFYTDNLKNFSRKIYDPTNFKGWKDETNKFVMMNYRERPWREYTFKSINVGNPNNCLTNAIAGCGKTTHIINNVIPNLGNDYLVVCPSQDTTDKYRENKMNVQVIQYFAYDPARWTNANTIIIDEIGLFDASHMMIIYKFMIAGKKILAWGDYTQMKPVKGKTLDNPDFLKSIFSKTEAMNDNHRNNFTLEYYNELRQSHDQEWLISEVKQHSTKKPEDAEIIICYKNDTCEKYNNLMLKHHGFKSMFEKKVKIMCHDSKLGEKGIYNKSIFEITDIKNNIFTITNKFESFKLKKNEINTHFKPAYARTIYSVQGHGFESYYFPDDKSDLKFIDNRSAYTIISRLKEEIINDPDDWCNVINI